MLIPSPVAEYLYPQWFSQGGGVFTLIKEDSLLNRKVWVVHMQKNNHDVVAWIDQETGVILKYTQETDGKLFTEASFSDFVVDQTVDDALFLLPADSVQNSN